MLTGIKKMWTLILIYSLIISHGEALPRQRVCVIGAGRAGLAAIKLLADQIEEFEPIAFERNSDVGGLWIYRENSNIDEHGLPLHSGIYKNLRTNLPLKWMMYPDYTEYKSRDSSISVSHEVFLKYLTNYADHFELRKYIQFDTLVMKVTALKPRCNETTSRWRVKAWDLNRNESNVMTCDAVMVCNGHFSKPNIPEIPGLENFFGEVLHSRSYRRPEYYTNRTVVLLGAGPSGVDIARDLSQHAKTVYISHRYGSFADAESLPANVLVVSDVAAANAREIIFEDQSRIIADTFMFCTGYQYDFPFLDRTSGIFIDRWGVHPLYKEFLNVNHPSMSFIGISPSLEFGSVYYKQSTTFLQILQGKEQLPSYEEMLRDEDSE